MLTVSLWFCLMLTAQNGHERAHSGNDVSRSLIEHGLTIEGSVIKSFAPSLPDGLGPQAERAVLLQVAGSEPRLDELLRDSVTAPFILKVRDAKTARGDLVRMGDLWFVVHADIDRIDPTDQDRGRMDNPRIEAGNMRFVSHLLDDPERAGRGLATVPDKNGRRGEWYVHHTGRMLDRIEIETTDRVTASRSGESWVIASRTEPRFDRDARFPNRWRAVSEKGESAPRPYPGGASLVKITKLAAAGGALLVEVHFAFSEPHAWFDGAPILRSKLSLIAQDRIRKLRRELAESQKRGAPRKP